MREYYTEAYYARQLKAKVNNQINTNQSYGNSRTIHPPHLCNFLFLLLSVEISIFWLRYFSELFQNKSKYKSNGNEGIIKISWNPIEAPRFAFKCGFNPFRGRPKY